MIKTRITDLLGIEYPIVQGGMRWASRAELSAAVSDAGGFGFLSAHTHPDAEALRLEIRRARTLTGRPFGVNLTVLASNQGIDYDAFVRVIIEERIPVVETAGSNPAKYIDAFKSADIKVVHKCTSVRHALKAEQLGADAISIDGFECAGHPGEDDVPGLILIPAAADKVKIPILASGGIADARGMIAALALGADGINMGTRFLITRESPLHPALKQRYVEASERDTVLVGRSYRESSRVMRSRVVEEALERERQGSVTHHDLAPLLGAPRWTKAMESGALDDGAVPAGMCVGLIHDIPTCAALIARIVAEAEALLSRRLSPMWHDA